MSGARKHFPNAQPRHGRGRALLFVLTLVAAACAPAPPGTPKPVASYPVRDIDMFNSWYDWAATPWFRIDDDVRMLPVQVILADNGMACIVTGGEWATATFGRPFACKSGWRFARRVR